MHSLKEARNLHGDRVTPEQLLVMVQHMKYLLTAILAFLLWDIAITFDDEVRYIWHLHRGSPTKWVFLITRYLAVFILSLVVSLNIPLALTLEQMNPSICHRIFIVVRIGIGILLSFVQALLMTRAYALCFRNRGVAVGMGALLIVQIPMIPIAVYLSLPSEYAVACVQVARPRTAVILVVFALLPFLIILGFTITKYYTGLKAGWGNIPIVSRLVKDDIMLVAGLVSWGLMTVLLSNFSSSVYGHIALYWILALAPSSVCRVVINMQRFGCIGAGMPPYSQQYPQFTTYLTEDLSRVDYGFRSECSAAAAGGVLGHIYLRMPQGKSVSVWNDGCRTK
ncbi:hypothetical protein BDQ17DRAFT_1433096 [Cyathus striatus]|nr:hypothetical protein BDQ17DRAFT_1433096 [Cyathus striatus]